MAIRVLKTSSALSASAGLYERVEAYNLTLGAATAIHTSTYFLTINTTRTISVTFATAGNQLGLLLYLKDTTAGTMTIKLYEGAVERTSDSFVLSSTCGSTFVGWHYFPLTAYAVTTAASTWSYKISCTSATPTVLVGTASGTDILYMATCDADSGIIVNTDTLVLGNSVTLTLDSSITLNATQNIAIIMCNGSTFQWENPPVSAYTLTLSGRTWQSNNTSFVVGSSANPIPTAQRATIDMSSTASAVLTYTPQSSSYWGGTGNYTNSLELYGAEDSKIATRIAADAAQSQANIVTTVDMSSDWAVGDNLSLIGKLKSGETTTYTINTIAGTTITLSANLDAKLLAGGAVVNLNRRDECGIWVLGKTSNITYLIYGLFGHFQVAGVYLVGTSFTGSAAVITTANTVKNNLIRNVLVYNNSLGCHYLYLSSNNGTYSGFYNYNNATTYAGFFYITGRANTISNVFLKNIEGITLGSATAGGIALLGSAYAASGLVVANADATATCQMIFLSGAAATISDIFCQSSVGYGVVLSALYSTTIDGLIAEDAITNNIYVFGTCLNLTTENATVGVDAPAGTSEIYLASSILARITFIDMEVGAGATVLDNLANTLPTSYVRFHSYDLTANDHRGYEYYGNTQSTGDGLSDTTVHTAGSGKFAIRFEPTSSTNNLAWDFTVPTGNILGQTMTVAVWCKINSATYYAGTHQMPRLTINYDNGTTTYAEAAQSTSWQLLAVNFAPTTSYGQITVTLSGRTDATTTNAYVYWDDFAVLYPAGYALDLGGMDLWANALPVTPPIATVLSAKDVWTAATTESYGANTMGEALKDVLTDTGTTLPATLATLPGDVWDVDLSAHTVVTKFGGWVQSKLLTVAKFLGLK